MQAYHSTSGSCAEDLFIELFSDAFGAEKAIGGRTIIARKLQKLVNDFE